MSMKKRVPGTPSPECLKTEKALLGATLASIDSFLEVERAGVRNEHFLASVHGRVFDCISDRFRRGLTIAPRDVAQALRDDRDLRSVGGAAYLESLRRGARDCVDIAGFAERLLREAPRQQAELEWEATHRPAIELVEPPSWDGAGLPARDWIYGQHLVRGAVSVTVSRPGVGRTTLAIAEAVALTSGRPLLGVPIHGGPKNVLFLPSVDFSGEAERRIAAARRLHGLKPEDATGRLYLNCRWNEDLSLWRDWRNDGFAAALRKHGIDVVIFDDFMAIGPSRSLDELARSWARIAREGGCAVALFDQHLGTPVVRSGVSIRRLTPMASDDAETKREALVQLEELKAQLAPPVPPARLRIVPVQLPNGDDVGSVQRDTSAEHLLAIREALRSGTFLASALSPRWAGHEVARVLGFDASSEEGKARAKALLQDWLKRGCLRVVERHDPVHRAPRQFIEIVAPASNA